MSAWTPGASGNRRGRPPKGRALTELMEKAGSKTVLRGDKKVARKTILAEMLWEAAMSGKVTFETNPDPCVTVSRTEALAIDEWFDIAKFIYSHVDGPPKTGLLDSLPEDATVEVKLVRTEGRKAATQETDPASLDS